MPTWNSVTIVGVGLIGGSIGLALRHRNLARRVIGVGRRQQSLEAALTRGCITEFTTNLAQAASQSDLIIVCTPVELIPEHIATAAQHCPANCLLTDAGSTKADVVAQTEAALAKLNLSQGPHFVGSHPLAGSEQSGCHAATADLFKGRVVVITETRDSDSTAVASIESFWQSLDARTIRMSPENHDSALARTSHLPHLIATALAAATPDDSLPLAATGWQDTTRIASGDVELWRQIFLANRGPTLKALADFETVLARLRSALETADSVALADLLAEGKRRRDALGS